LLTVLSVKERSQQAETFSVTTAGVLKKKKTKKFLAHSPSAE